MPNSFTATGLTVATISEVITNLTTGFQTIYGADTNFDPDSPDGQAINIFARSVVDLEDLLVQINASFDPDQAFGVTLDQRVSYNGIKRKAGTYTTTNITLTTIQALNLPGLDQVNPDDPTSLPAYTVSDNAGNQWQLITSQTIPSAGTYVYSFQSATIGAVLTIPNTITVPVTIILGVATINNPTTYDTLGITEETDAELKVRRQQSTALSSQGYAAALEALLNNINGVTSAKVNENDGSATNSDGVPGHSIWVIVKGGTDEQIANAIYQKRNAGCGMFGAQSYTITQLDGSPFIINWDYVSPEDLYIKFSVASLDGENAPNIALIMQNLVTLFVPGVFAQVNINDLATIIQQIDPNTLVMNAGFSTSAGGTFTPTLTPSAKDLQFDVQASHIIVTPIILNSPTSMVSVVGGNFEVTQTIAPSTASQLTPLGGYGPFTYALTTNASGGTVGTSTGLYTSGATAGNDVVTVTDSQSNTATILITVS